MKDLGGGKARMEGALEQEELLCIACEVPMEVGFMVDSAHAAILQSRWCAGVPQKSWTGSEVHSKQFKAAIKVTTYRCPSCGRLESFALQEPEEKAQ